MPSLNAMSFKELTDRKVELRKSLCEANRALVLIRRGERPDSGSQYAASNQSDLQSIVDRTKESLAETCEQMRFMKRFEIAGLPTGYERKTDEELASLEPELFRQFEKARIELRALRAQIRRNKAKAAALDLSPEIYNAVRHIVKAEEVSSKESVSAPTV